MATIIFYEANPIDTFQLSESLKPTDHYWEFRPDAITLDNINPETEVLSVFVNSKVSREIMERLPKLKLVATRTSGFDHIDIDYANSRGIVVANVPSYGGSTVAEHVFVLLLSLSRKIIPTVDSIKQGTYRSSNFTGFDLKDLTIGIIGLGRIGQHVAHIANGFQMEILACDRKNDPDIAKKFNLRYATFEEVLSSSDIVTLHTPLNPDNFHMMNKSSISKMKRGAILINTARGELVESRALITALDSGHLAGAGLDTIEGENFLYGNNDIQAIVNNATSPESYIRMAEVEALMHLPNVIVTPHSAFNTVEAIKRINSVTTDNIIKFWFGDSPNQVQIQRNIGRLIVIRHGESEWNALGKWTGTTDVNITKKGIEKSKQLGEKFTQIHIDYAYVSEQVRTAETLEAFKEGSDQHSIHSESAKAINERDYGVYTGMRKDKIAEIIGKEAFNELRRSWDSPVEGGESLRDVYERVIPFYLRIILPRLRHGQNVLIIAHGNSIRSLIKYVENISDETIGETEMIQDSALVYEVDFEGRCTSKSIFEIGNSSEEGNQERIV